MTWCDSCLSVHFPGECRKPAVMNWGFPGGFNYASQVYSPVSNTPAEPPSAFNQPPDDPAVKLCRPCQSGDRVAGFIHACAGNGCECPVCHDLLPLLDELNNEWEFLERWNLVYKPKRGE